MPDDLSSDKQDAIKAAWAAYLQRERELSKLALPTAFPPPKWDVRIDMTDDVALSKVTYLDPAIAPFVDLKNTLHDLARQMTKAVARSATETLAQKFAEIAAQEHPPTKLSALATVDLSELENTDPSQTLTPETHNAQENEHPEPETQVPEGSSEVHGNCDRGGAGDTATDCQRSGGSEGQ